jgi:hypothetical protein
MSIEETAKLCDVSLTQVTKWDAGYKPIPSAKRKLMELFRLINLEHIGWKGWSFKNGVLYSPMGFSFQPQMLECLAIINMTDAEKWTISQEDARFRRAIITRTRRQSKKR